MSKNKSQDNKYFFSLVWDLITPYRMRLSMGALSIISVNALEMIPPIIFKEVAVKVGEGDVELELWPVSLSLIAIYFGMAILRWVWRYCFFVTSRHIESDIKDRIFDKILSAPYSKASRLKIGNTISIFSQDANDLRWFVGLVGLLIFDTGSYLFYIPIMLILTLGPAGLLLMLPFLFIPFLMSWYEKRMNFLYRRSSEGLGKVADWTYEETIGVKVLRVLSLQAKRRSKYSEILHDLYQTHIGIGKVDIVLDAVLNFLTYCARSILFFCAYFALTGNWNYFSKFAIVGNIILVMRVLDRLVWPMASFGEIANLTEKAKAATKRMREVFDLEEQVFAEKIIGDKIEKVQISDLHFSYPGNNSYPVQVLKGCSISLERGQKVGIVGHVGSGKTTLLKIMAGLFSEYEIDKYFEYSVNNVDFKNIDLRRFKKKVSYLPQDSVVFNASIFTNVAPEGKRSRKEVLEALNKAEMTSDISSFPEGLETPIGEKGLNLSGGQKQRVSLARSFLSGAHLFLWDDVISALDIATEKKVVSNIHTINPDAILVLATHRPSALRSFDKIYVMGEGQIIEEGTFDELIKNRSSFYELFQYEEKTRDLAKDGVEG